MKKYVLIGTIVFFGIIFLIVMSIPVSCTGREFCPQTFELRSFSYWKNGFGPHNMDRAAPTNPSGNSITKYLLPATSTIRWDLVSGTYSKTNKEGDSDILVKYLEAMNIASTWNLAKWSDDHPDLAAILWPKVQWLAVHNLYFAIPELIRYGQGDVTTEEFQKFADKHSLKAAIAQVQHFLESEPTPENEIFLFRLTRWLDTQAVEVAAIEDDELSRQYDTITKLAKERTAGLSDGILSNELTVPQVPSTTAPPAAKP